MRPVEENTVRVTTLAWKNSMYLVLRRGEPSRIGETTWVCVDLTSGTGQQNCILDDYLLIHTEPM